VQKEKFLQIFKEMFLPIKNLLWSNKFYISKKKKTFAEFLSFKKEFLSKIS